MVTCTKTSYSTYPAAGAGASAAVATVPLAVVSSVAGAATGAEASAG